MAMPFTHHTVARSTVELQPAAGQHQHISASSTFVGNGEDKPRISLCTGCYEGRGDHTLYLPRRKARRCEACADEHPNDTCFLAKCVFCGEDAIVARREGKSMWYACEKHEFFTFQADKWKPLPLNREEKRTIRRQRIMRRMSHLRRGAITLSAVSLLYFFLLRTPLREHYDFDLIDYASTLWSGVSGLFDSFVQLGTTIAQSL
ncbi:hypothetical protein KQI65_06815 [bacterium]|nr:hypothetical protein [bacterium]